MKSFAVLLSTCALAAAADFQNGQAARAVIGQPTFTAQQSATSDQIVGGVSGIAYANGSLYVVDSNRVGASPQNNRVLVFRDLPSQITNPTAEIPAQGLTATDRCPLCKGAASIVLGQADFTTSAIGLTERNLRQPTGIATDGTRLVVADTDNNRVLIWNRIPADINTAADVVVGQPDFKTAATPRVPTNGKLKAPQGVWIQGSRLFVADSQNGRVLIWNNIPTGNGQAADVVLGQPNFTAAPSDDPRNVPKATPSNMLTPVSVTSDGVRLYVADLGYNRVMVWNSIPTQTAQPADLAVGQVDLTSSDANNVKSLCAPNGTDSTGANTYPLRCGSTLNFPRFALSDGQRLFIADGGNDRVLVFNTIPTTSGKAADVVLGQPDEFTNIASDPYDPFQFGSIVSRISAADIVRTPISLAWDGTNLFVSDPFNRRVSVFSSGSRLLPYNSVRNAASRDVSALGTVTLSGTIKENDTVSILIAGKEYKVTVAKDDTLESVVTKLVTAINAEGGDPNAVAIANTQLVSVLLISRLPGESGNNITLSSTVSTTATITASASSATLSGGQNAARIAPGTLISIEGENLADQTASSQSDPLPRELGGVQVYIDGIRAPILYVSPRQINAQIPYEISDAQSVSAYIRVRRNNGTVESSAAIAVPIIDANPGVFAQDGPEPRQAIAIHANSSAVGTVSIDGSIKENDVATITIEDRSYTYTVKAADTLAVVRDALIAAINGNADEKVRAEAGTVFTRVRLIAKAPGTEGNGIKFSGTATAPGGSPSLLVTAYGSELCCASTGGARVTQDNPAVPGEQIIVYATGLGLVTPLEASDNLFTGSAYSGTPQNSPGSPVNSLVGAKTAQVLGASLKTGPDGIGVYEVLLELSRDLPTNDITQLWIAQGFQISNLVTIPVRAPDAQ